MAETREKRPEQHEKQKEILEEIEEAASTVGKAWPLHSFVTANPLAGFEDEEFHEAVGNAERVFGGSGYPDADVLRKAWEAGRIDADPLSRKLAENGYDGEAEREPEELLERVEAESAVETRDAYPSEWDEVDGIVSKWLSVFLDQGISEWGMPGRSEGFYGAWQELARYDSSVPSEAYADLPDDPVEAVEEVVSDVPEEDLNEVFESQFASLPGWTGLIRWRAESDDGWQEEHPVTLVGYLAVRLALTDAFDAPLVPDGDETTEEDERLPLAGVWLEAWEETYRDELTGAVSESADENSEKDGDDSPPDAQLVFCIDTRSEVIRRHVEKAGRYETHGYAGFFGVPIRYEGYGTDVSVDAHPPILEPEHRVADVPVDGSAEREKHDAWSGIIGAARGLVKTLKTNAATAFPFVEKAGVGYGAALTARTLSPTKVYDALDALDRRVPDEHEFCEPELDHDGDADEDALPVGMTLEEKVEYAAAAFELTGWEEFARLVAFVGHAGQTTNNPFDSALDCGACAANPGGPNARVLASICNDDEVRAELRERGIDIPDDTVFVAGEHNTTTDEITLFDDDIPESHVEDVESLRADLREAREGAAEERADSMDARRQGVRETERRAADWAETRPEWGLAGNAAFVIGPRSLTEDFSLDGRSFLHSYDPSTDPYGEALEGIMLGPMVVTQWINTQYYFATVDNAVYGSGSKITQNPVGNVGVLQGNGGDAMTGLPLESLYATDEVPYHQPIRLSVVVYAPADRVERVLEENDHLWSLVENGWLRLSVVDPERGNDVLHYTESGFEEEGAEAAVESTD